MSELYILITVVFVTMIHLSLKLFDKHGNNQWKTKHIARCRKRYLFYNMCCGNEFIRTSRLLFIEEYDRVKADK